MDPATLMAVGTVMQVAGTYQANIAQAKKEKRTAEFFQTQANFAREAMFRELHIAERQYAYRLGSQISAVAKGGADVGVGSVVNTFASTIAAQIDELLAIKRKGALDIELATLRGQGAAELAETLSSNSYNLMQASTTTLNNVAKSSDSWATRPTYSNSSVIQSPGSSSYNAPSVGGSGYQSQYLGRIGG